MEATMVGDPTQSSSFDRLLAALSARFVNLPPDAVDSEIISSLEQIGEALDLDRTLLGEFGEEGTDSVVLHSWARSGYEPIAVGTTWGTALPSVLAAVHRGEIVRVNDTRELPPGWEIDRKEYVRSGAMAHLSMPFSVAGAALGIFTAVSIRAPVEWSDELILQLKLLAEVFAHSLSRRDVDIQLRSALAEVQMLKAKLEAENRYLRDEVVEAHNFDTIVGRSDLIEGVLHTIEQVAPTDASVLIRGETGTGKELVARALHSASGRSERPLIKLNCAALPAALAESELFGHEKGAFTGAVSRRIGRFELADRGTILLDEVGDLPLEVQAKLLRVLQDGEFERLGSAKTIAADVRVISATSRDLERAIEEGSFRSDLYYRLRVVPIELPPLRARRGDIPELVWSFIEKMRMKHGKAIKEVPQRVMDALVHYDWPGNVRELENIIERAVILSPSLSLEVDGAYLRGGPVTAPSDVGNAEEDLAAVERTHIIDVLERCGWRVKGPGNAAERLGLNPSTLRGRMRKLDITRPFD
jgi:formate hydrogenlyase transcriptional activator